MMRNFVMFCTLNASGYVLNNSYKLKIQKAPEGAFIDKIILLFYRMLAWKI
jgi:hypothetical protein